MATQVRNFKAHQKLLMDVIKRQAGSLDKGVLEGVMNAIEAGSMQVRVTVDKKCSRLTIEDDGKGITSLQEIESFFETFGQPHSADENKLWAQFRMGRGQLFSFGRNVWRTGTFQLTVDIQTMGLDYELETDLPAVKGCKIDVRMYTPGWGTYGTIESFQRAIQQQIEFIGRSVLFNKVELTKSVDSVEWSNKDDDAYYLWDAGVNLRVYNLGAFVREYDTHQIGVPGIVVSRRQLQVNFARNDIQSDCPVWQRIFKVIDREATRRRRLSGSRSRGHVMSSGERINALRTLYDRRDNVEDCDELTILRLTTGRHIRLMDMKKHKYHWSVAPAFDMRADRMNTSYGIIVLDENVLHEVGYSGNPGNFFKALTDSHPDYRHLAKLYRDFSALSAEIRDDMRVLSLKDLKPAERSLVSFLNQFLPVGRTFVIGDSEVADGWTDASTYIAIARQFLRKHVNRSDYGYIKLLTLITHELCHDIRSDTSHSHDFSFFQRFHDLISDSATSPLRLAPYMKSKFREFDMRTHKEQREARSRKRLERATGAA